MADGLIIAAIISFVVLETNYPEMTRKTLFGRIAIILCGLILSFSAFAQNSFTVKLKLIDAKTSEPVGYATTSLTVKGASKAADFVMTDEDGTASLTKISKGTYIVKAELMGYKTFEQEIVVDKNIDLGAVKLSEDVELLDAASVSAVGNPIIVKKDTVEYNASSFKTSDNDMLEELLKKLPGVEVGSDGSITANGESITKIMIDGKPFFLDDPQLASKNIPAKMIEKIKVVEKKSDQALFTGIDDGEEEMVIDLSMKPGMMDGMFGNMMAGGGYDIAGRGSDMSDPRFQAAAMIGKFTDNGQVSIILNGNNTNNRGFNDVAGGMMRDMRGGGRGNGGGITTSWMGGMNGAWDLFDGDMELSGNYLYNRSSRVSGEESSRVTYMDDDSRLLNNNSSSNLSNSQGHRFGVRMEHDFSKNTSIVFEPQINFGGGSYAEHSDFYTDRAVGDAISHTNKGFTDNSGSNKNWTASGFFLLRQKLGKQGRTMSVNFRYNFRNNEMLGYNQSLTYADTDNDGSWDVKPEIVNQKEERFSKNASLNGRIVYTEPVAKDLYLEANYQYGWTRNISEKTAYNSGNLKAPLGSDVTSLVFQEEGSYKDETYSNNILNRTINQRGGLSLSYQKPGLRAQVGVAVTPTDTYNETNGETYKSNVINWAPQATFNYEFNDYAHMRVRYNGRSSQPSTSQLMPVPDNSDPLNISLGNPYLKPYFSHNLNANFGYTNKETFTSVNGNVSAGMVDGAITNAKWYDASSVQYSIPVNGPGTYSANGRIMVNSPLGQSDFSIYSNTNASYNESTSYIGKGTLDSGKYYDAANADFNYDLFHQDFPDLSEAGDSFTENKTQTVSFTQRLRLTYRNDLVELIAGGRTRMSKSWYTVANANINATWSNQVEFSMNWTIPGGLNIIADADYNWYNGYTTPQEDEIILNAEINQLLFNNKFTIALKAYDILGQSKNLSVSDSSNYHLETRNNTLGRYIILSLTYRFGDFNPSDSRRGGGGYRRR